MGQVAELLTNIYYGMHWAILEGQDLPFLVSDVPYIGTSCRSTPMFPIAR